MSTFRHEAVLFIVCSISAIAEIMAVAQPAQTADFRVENTVFSENAKEPSSRSTTLFYRSAVYDFMQDPEEVIVFDKTSGRIDLLDVRRGVRTDLDTAEVTKFAQGLKEMIQKSQDPLMKFMGAPKFEQQFDEAKHELTLTSPWMIYQVRGASVEGLTAAQYREFSDEAAQLNVLLNPGARPPFSRLALNDALAKHNLIAREVTLTTPARKGSAAKQSTMRSEHRLEMQLSASDLERIQQAQKWLISFKRVGFEEYRKTSVR